MADSCGARGRVCQGKVLVVRVCARREWGGWVSEREASQEGP